MNNSHRILIVLTLFCIHHRAESASTRDKRQTSKRGYTCPFPNGQFADPKDCRRFYICNNNHPYNQRCPASLVFDDRTKYCNYKTEGFQCGPIDYTTTPRPPPDPLAAKKCSRRDCKLPDCFCSSDGTIIPGKLKPEETPQMILLAFDGALNQMTDKKYMQVFNKTRNNPNGCPITGTFYISHEYSSYHSVQKMYEYGHEIALNSISYRGPEKWWSTASYSNWTEEFVGGREIISNFADIPRERIIGLRAPYLETGGENQFEMMAEYGIAYDSSIAVPKGRLPLWPYTLDYKLPHKCLSKKCPKRTYPGIWEIPLNSLYNEEDQWGTCYLADQCVFFPSSEEIIYEWLLENFRRHYDANRAPLGLSFHINWFNEQDKVRALIRFVDTILVDYKDAYFVTAQQLLAWMQTPEPTSKLQGFEPWLCSERPTACNIPNNCALTFDQDKFGDVRYMPTCRSCPANYPWIGNYDGGYVKEYITEERSDGLLDEENEEDDSKVGEDESVNN